MASVRKSEARDLILTIGICEAVGGIGSLLNRSSISTWYPSLRKPSFNPPNWVFGPVWTLLYALMGVSEFLIRRQRANPRHRRRAQQLFGIQLVLNGLWTPLFFGLRSPVIALVDIGLLWLAIVAAIPAFMRISKVAAVLLVPYLLWVTFAAALNEEIWRLNRGR